MEIMPTVQGIDYLTEPAALDASAPTARRHAVPPGDRKVVLQPLGVVGIISPWNYPASLCLMPLAPPSPPAIARC